MELRLYLSIIRRRWPLVAALPILVALLSLALALARPPVYGVSVPLLVTRGDRFFAPGDDIEQASDDTTALDLPAVLSSVPFAQDVARELARGGRALDPAAVRAAISASQEKHVVTLSVTAGDPAEALAIAETAVATARANGLRYWGDPRATPGNPGINIAVLEPPGAAARLNGARVIAAEVALRTALGLVAGVGLAFALHYLGYRPAPDDQRRAADV